MRLRRLRILYARLANSHSCQEQRACRLGIRAKNKENVLKLCVLPAWWLWRSVHTRSHLELGRKSLQRQWYFVSRHGRVGRRQARKEQLLTTLKRGLPFHMSIRRRNRARPRKLDAGWSSPVARQAHNLKAAGSNPAPATKKANLSKWLESD